MRKIININQEWIFEKGAGTVPTILPTEWEAVNLPHTWNAEDGMDGDADYFRGTCHYAKLIKNSELPEADSDSGYIILESLFRMVWRRNLHERSIV